MAGEIRLLEDGTVTVLRPVHRFRHPLLPATTVVPNSYTSDADLEQINVHILTGFNCSGKTIYIKQVNLQTVGRIRRSFFIFTNGLDWVVSLFGTDW